MQSLVDWVVLDDVERTQEDELEELARRMTVHQTAFSSALFVKVTLSPCKITQCDHRFAHRFFAEEQTL